MRIALSAILVVIFASFASAQSFVDPGFENYSVPAGEFVRPGTGPWSFGNDAAVVRPFAPPTFLDTFQTWSATRAAFEGEQYASTYAGADTLLQQVSFPSAGNYTVSVMAFAPDGELFFQGSPIGALLDGKFTFVLDGASVGTTFVVPAGSDWTKYQTALNISAAGTHTIGIKNTLSATYFINYDSMSIPEPSSAVVLTLSALLAARRRK